MKLFAKNNWIFSLGMLCLLAVQLLTVCWFGVQKQGYHYDEYYSYYSTNVTDNLVPTDGEWKSGESIRNEFMVIPGAGLDFGRVKLMQSYDVHPPLYYYMLHLVSGMTAGIFSKWQGLGINLVFFVLSWLVLAALTTELSGKDKKKIAAVCLLYGFSPAIYSGTMFIRMYVMLTFFCMLILYLHIRAIMREKRSLWGYYVPVGVLAFLGFQIHYYFAVFLFFLAAAVSLYLFFHKETRKESFVYAGTVLAGMLLSVAAYPVCLGHIFRGYRGTEAQDAFFDVANIKDRLGLFVGLTNEYVFGGFLALLLVVWVLLSVVRKAEHHKDTKRKISEAEVSGNILIIDDETGESDGIADINNRMLQKQLAFYLTALVSMGYFLVVAKTALLNGLESVRYEMPVYGLLILLVVIGLGECLESFSLGKNRKLLPIFSVILLLFALTGNLNRLSQKEVAFLYTEDKVNVDWATEHRNEVVVHIYNPNNAWMVWDESEELMQYDRIYFISSAHENVVADEILSNADSIYIYQMRGEAAEEMLQKVLTANGGFSKVELIRELLYCDLYRVSR